MDILLADLIAGINHEYRSADDEGLPFADGEYQWPRWDTWDIIYDRFADDIGDEPLIEAIYENTKKQFWAVRDGWRLSKDRWLQDAWDEFTKRVHSTEVIPNEDWLSIDIDSSNPDSISPKQILEEVFESASELGLIRNTVNQLQLSRVRPREQGWENWGARDLGTAPDDFAAENRFSRRGNGMFYGAEDTLTAIKEIRLDSHATGVVGVFQPNRGISYLDLTELPPIPSVFDRNIGHLHRDIMFLHSFVNECSKIPDASTAIDNRYTPTQTVSSFMFNSTYTLSEIQAIRFPSSLTGKPCWVIDLPQERCVDDGNSSQSDLLLILKSKELFEPEASTQERQQAYR